jgi:hypothetical protein
MDTSNDLNQLMIARRLMLDAQQFEVNRKGKRTVKKTLKQKMDQDQALISGNTPAATIGAQKTQMKTDDTQIKLSELIAQLKELSKQQVDIKTSQVQVSVQQVVEREASFRYTVLEKVEGLVRNSQTMAETDRYSFEFSDGVTFKITDKWNNRSTTIWGDPHVDVDDVEGTYNGDFKDLKTSDSHTTFMLLDGTRVSFTARDEGVIERVDIFNGSQHLGGVGQASASWNQESGLFAAEVDANVGMAASLPKGDTVYAGGDGNDWFASSGELLWGKTTAAAVNSRPYSVMQFEYRETITEQISMQVNKQV